MAGLKAIKQKIRSTDKTRKVTKAMEAVSAAKMRKAQQKAIAGRAYARAAVSILSRVSGSRALLSHPLTQTRSLAHATYIIITSDKGLAGALNSSVLRNTLADMQQSGVSKDHTSVIAIGRKANDFFLNRGYSVERYHPNTDEVTDEVLRGVISETAERFMSGKTDLVRIGYQNFVSTFEQRPTLRTMFPLSLDELSKVVEDITPRKGAFAEEGTSSAPTTYTVEPSEEGVLSAILPRLAGIFLFHALLEAQASEHSARMVSMKSASDKAGEM